ncbi:MAG: shikimate kinase, partial [Sulfobacillus sp.]|nr:shikimate kinase [Sulfobacillus sp.]
MGAGKSTVAQQLATRLEWPWYDLDHETETIAGES